MQVVASCQSLTFAFPERDRKCVRLHSVAGQAPLVVLSEGKHPAGNRQGRMMVRSYGFPCAWPAMRPGYLPGSRPPAFPCTGLPFRGGAGLGSWWPLRRVVRRIHIPRLPEGGIGPLQRVEEEFAGPPDHRAGRAGTHFERPDDLMVVSAQSVQEVVPLLP